MKRLVILAATSLLITGGNLLAQRTAQEQRTGPMTSPAQQLSKEDREFIQRAAEIGQGEVALGRLGQAEATRPEVKQYAQDLVAGHTRSNQQLASLAQQKGVQIPNQPSKAAQTRIQALSRQSGEKFDKEFLELAERDHRRALDQFQDAARKVSDPDVKAWAQSMVPELQQHLAMARRPEAIGEAPRKQHPQRQQPQTEPQRPSRNQY